MVKPVAKRKLYEDVSEQIIEMVKKGEWHPGDQLASEAELANIFQVSRNCIREALKALEMSGIIFSQAGRGTYITDGVLENIYRQELLCNLQSGNSKDAEIREARSIIEVQAVALAALRADEADIAEMQKRLEDIKNCCGTYRERMYMNSRFHKAMLKSSKNLVLFQLYKLLSTQQEAQRINAAALDNFTDPVVTSANHQQRDYEEHKELLDAIIAKDAKLAAERMCLHLHVTLPLDGAGISAGLDKK